MEANQWAHVSPLEHPLFWCGPQNSLASLALAAFQIRRASGAPPLPCNCLSVCASVGPSARFRRVRLTRGREPVAEAEAETEAEAEAEAEAGTEAGAPEEEEEEEESGG